ncbi:uncharacterized protein BO87DRAFT_463260 [Aspergillus neoniger CBS 115656]|uniref:Uncharacterized protein n=1 Tax=Aspergillus neoniger (strain CBS 115656) TaxID=1448310 RepID=A0A318Y5M4_ASPNB|nr:hypothetical protein BO87DRAFT_463260 [Aspergillus neoniger CBS 115656]PYH29169.1 hypothetical protein BO87DRAFT_463260 [Aspergillus neoniger CBS 115656]
MQTSHCSTGFYALLRQKRLLVPPSLWTSRHLDILGCQFEEIRSLPSSGAESHTSSLSSVDPKLKDDSGSDAARLARSGAVLIKLYRLVDILDYEGSPLKTRKTGIINFYFAGRVVHRLECAIFWRRLQENQLEHSPADLLVGYFNYNDMVGYRRECDRERRARRLGQTPVVHRSAGENRLLTRDWKSDPYLVCVLLSLGQLQRRLRHPRHQNTYASHLLVTNASDSQFIYLYEMQIPNEILRALDTPNTANCVEWPPIRRSRIPFQPYDTFRRRLEEVLLEER